MTTKTQSRTTSARGGKSPKVDVFIRQASQWRDEMTKVRSLLLESGFTEDLKWSKPCYSYDGSNAVIFLPLKHHFALLFFKGALLKDPDGVLIKPGENSQAGRQMRFTGLAEIEENEAVIKKYLQQAIDVEKAGLKVEFTQSKELVFPPEFQRRLDRDAALKKAFTSLTPGRQRAYNIFFSGAKQSQTRESRVQKCVPRILSGRGLDDR